MKNKVNTKPIISIVFYIITIIIKLLILSETALHIFFDDSAQTAAVREVTLTEKYISYYKIVFLIIVFDIIINLIMKKIFKDKYDSKKNIFISILITIIISIMLLIL